MKKAADKTTHSRSGKNDFTIGRLALDFLDTTWRIAIPVIVFAGGGLLADKQLESAPWLTLLGMVIGFLFAGLLIRKQLADVARKDGEQ
jgi:F0F1-type ATP synthase assembly protein I